MPVCDRPKRTVRNASTLGDNKGEKTCFDFLFASMDFETLSKTFLLFKEGTQRIFFSIREDEPQQ